MNWADIIYGTSIIAVGRVNLLINPPHWFRPSYLQLSMPACRPPRSQCQTEQSGSQKDVIKQQQHDQRNKRLQSQGELPSSSQLGTGSFVESLGCFNPLLLLFFLLPSLLLLPPVLLPDPRSSHAETKRVESKAECCRSKKGLLKRVIKLVVVVKNRRLVSKIGRAHV